MATLSDLLALKASESVSGGMEAGYKRNAEAQAAQALAGTNQQAAKAKSLADLLKVEATAKANAEGANTQFDHSQMRAMESQGLDMKNPEHVREFGKIMLQNKGRAGKDSYGFGGDQTLNVAGADSRATAKNAIREKTLIGKNVRDLNNEIDGPADVYDTLLDITKNPNGVNKGHIKTLMSRIESGKFKPLAQTIPYAGGQKTLGEVLIDKLNMVTGDDAAGIPQNQLTDIVDTMHKHFEPAIKNYIQRATDTRGSARSLGVDLTEEDQEAMVNAPISAREKRLTSTQAALNDYLTKHPKTQGPMSGIAGSLPGNPSPPKLTDAEMSELATLKAKHGRK